MESDTKRCKNSEEGRRRGEGEKGKRGKFKMSVKIIRHQDLEVYKKAFSAAMEIFEKSKSFSERRNLFAN